MSSAQQLAEKSHILVHAREQGGRALLAAAVEQLGAEAIDLGSVSDDDLFHDSAAVPVLAQTGGPSCPLGRLLRETEGNADRHRPIVVLVHGEDLGPMWRRVEPWPHVSILAEPVAFEELVSILRALLAVTALRQQMADLLAQVAIAHRDIQRLNLEAESETRRRAQFLAAVSHDLRTPIYEIGLVTQLARAEAGDAGPPTDWDRLVAGLSDGVANLRERVDDLFDLSRLDLGAVQCNPDPFLLGPFLERILLPYRTEAEAKGLHVQVDLPDPRTEVVGDADKIARIVQDFLSNAVKFTERGEISISARTEDGLKLVIRDTGRGIAAETVGTIFDEFAQLGNPERDHRKGTGLGLAICQRLARIMGGTVSVESEIGHGSTFTLAIPDRGGAGD